MGGHGWGRTEERELVGAINAALESGVSFFDTADVYGLGRSESLLGAVLKEHRPRVVLATKFGVRMENGRTFHDNSPAWIRSALEGSLKRLKTDYVDLYQIHYRDGRTPISEVVETLNRLKEKGLIRYSGLSNIYKSDCGELRDYPGCFVSFQNEYSLARRTYEDDITWLAEELNMTPMTWGSLGQGILTGKYDRKTNFGADDRRSRSVYRNFYGSALTKNLAIAQVIQDIADDQRKPPAAVALRFILDRWPQSVVLAGAKRPDQVTGQAEAAGWRLTDEQFQRLERVSKCQDA